MPNVALFREAMRAMAQGEKAKGRKLKQQIPSRDNDAFDIYVSAVFAGIAGQVFREDRSQAAVQAFLGEAASELEAADLSPPLLESMLRALFDGEHLSDEVTPDVQLRTQCQAIRVMVRLANLYGEGVNESLRYADNLLGEWVGEEVLAGWAAPAGGGVRVTA